MNINDYIANIESLINASPIITGYNLNIDKKTGDIAFISGRIDFIDGSSADFKEFVEDTGAGVEKYKYGYNYRTGPNVFFRYDNAPDPGARRLITFPHHKHTENDEIMESASVELSDVLAEIEEIVLKKWNY